MTFTPLKSKHQDITVNRSGSKTDPNIWIKFNAENCGIEAESMQHVAQAGNNCFIGFKDVDYQFLVDLHANLGRVIDSWEKTKATVYIQH
jgi:hypothetical protein